MVAMTSRALVWFKRDLRLQDHAPLQAAAQCDEALALYVVEPEWVRSDECDAQHLAFAQTQVASLRAALAARGLRLLVRWGSVPEVLTTLRREWAFTDLMSHEETGPGWSYTRDRAVMAWCRGHGVAWREWPQSGVVRGLRNRSGWALGWQRRMNAPLVVTPDRWRAASGADAIADGQWPDREIAQAGHGLSRPLPAGVAGGEAAAWQTLDDFLEGRGRHYRSALSSPLTAEQGCSRISAWLAFGVLSMRQVHQATEARVARLRNLRDREANDFAWHLRGFASRLRWHCHFMQKLESQPEIEWVNMARTCDGLREEAFDRERLEAWRTGHTGYPMVDACMRSLNATGWLNFRMRAMLVSFAAYHLWLHWREPGLHLARQFLDFEPGIHWSQMQMQSGTTGINTLRMYSPARQQVDHDPHGEFIRRWVPEFGSAAYPPPIVDERSALQHARDRLYALRHTAPARAEADAVQARHGSRKSGLPPTGRARRRAATPLPNVQASLFD